MEPRSMGPLSQRRGSPKAELSTARRNKPAQRHQAEQLHPTKPQQPELRRGQENDHSMGNGRSSQRKAENSSQKQQAENQRRELALSKSRSATGAESFQRDGPPPSQDRYREGIVEHDTRQPKTSHVQSRAKALQPPTHRSVPGQQVSVHQPLQVIFISNPLALYLYQNNST